jgi:hypothetical protein
LELHVTTPELVAKATQPLVVMLLPPSRGVPVIAGKLNVTLPNAPVTGWIVTVPEVALPIVSDPRVPDAPSVGVDVSAGVAPARICPAPPATAQVPDVVIVPPVNPVPQVTDVTVPVAVLVDTATPLT